MCWCQPADVIAFDGTVGSGFMGLSWGGMDRGTLVGREASVCVAHSLGVCKYSVKYIYIIL